MDLWHCVSLHSARMFQYGIIKEDARNCKRKTGNFRDFFEDFEFFVKTEKKRTNRNKIRDTEGLRLIHNALLCIYILREKGKMHVILIEI